MEKCVWGLLVLFVASFASAATASASADDDGSRISTAADEARRDTEITIRAFQDNTRKQMCAQALRSLPREGQAWNHLGVSFSPPGSLTFMRPFVKGCSPSGCDTTYTQGTPGIQEGISNWIIESLPLNKNHDSRVSNPQFQAIVACESAFGALPKARKVMDQRGYMIPDPLPTSGSGSAAPLVPAPLKTPGTGSF